MGIKDKAEKARRKRTTHCKERAQAQEVSNKAAQPVHKIPRTWQIQLTLSLSFRRDYLNAIFLYFDCM